MNYAIIILGILNLIVGTILLYCKPEQKPISIDNPNLNNRSTFLYVKEENGTISPGMIIGSEQFIFRNGEWRQLNGKPDADKKKMLFPKKLVYPGKEGYFNEEDLKRLAKQGIYIGESTSNEVK